MAVEISLQESDLRRHRLQRLEAMLTQDPISCDEKTTQELFTAAKQGDVDEFIRVVERHFSKRNLRLCLRVILSPSRNSLLHVAAGLERDEILRAIVNHFSEQFVAGKNCREDTALHLAARAGRAPAALVLIGQASNVGGVEMRQALVQVKNDRGNTPLHEAVVNGHLDVVHLLMGEDLQPMYWKNKEGKCPMYLAVESGNLEVLRLLLTVPLDPSNIQGVSPVHATVLYGNLDMLREMSERNPGLLELRDDRFETPLHLAAHINYCDGITFLRDKFASSAVKYDKEGNFPIHVACKEGHVQAIKELLWQWPDPTELINRHGQNILHVSARHGSIQAVKYILSNADLEKLINEKDNNGNTPLHLATLPWQPVALLHLVLDKRVDLTLVNNECLTALDVATEEMKRMDLPRKKRLPFMLLKSAGASGSRDLAMSKRRDGEILAMTVNALQKGGSLRDQVNTRLLVAMLVATVTFAAGFAIPGGYNDSPGAEPGMATLLNRSMFQAFIICNTTAMYNAIGVVLVLPWAQLDDPYISLTTHIIAMLELLIALGTMSVAFMAGCYVLISKLTWLASVILLMGAGALSAICPLYVAMYVPPWIQVRYFGSITFYLVCLGIVIQRTLLHFPDVMEDEDSGPAGRLEWTRSDIKLDHPSSLNRLATLPPVSGNQPWRSVQGKF